VKANGDKFLTEEFKFVPHITIFKGGRERKKTKKGSKKRKKKKSKLTNSRLSEFWEQFEDFYFGEQILECVELLRMQSMLLIFICFLFIYC
jgi:2'-5' RNA ligase